MATQFTPNVGLGYPAVDDSGWGAALQALFLMLDSLGPVGSLAVRMREVPSTSLFVAVAAGHMVSSSAVYVPYAGTTITLTASATTFLWLDDTGTLNTGSTWPATAHVRLAIVVARASTITSVTDARVSFTSATGAA